jgi:Domain of unknown function (DUF4288)
MDTPNPMPSQTWYSVRCLFRSDRIDDGQPVRTFEERVVIFRAVSYEGAIAKGEAEAKKYAENWPHPKILEHIVAFGILEEELNEGQEVWSCMRDLDISDEEFLKRFYEGEAFSLSNMERDKPSSE